MGVKWREGGTLKEGTLIKDGFKYWRGKTDSIYTHGFTPSYVHHQFYGNILFFLFYFSTNVHLLNEGTIWRGKTMSIYRGLRTSNILILYQHSKWITIPFAKLLFQLVQNEKWRGKTMSIYIGVKSIHIYSNILNELPSGGESPVWKGGWDDFWGLIRYGGEVKRRGYFKRGDTDKRWF